MEPVITSASNPTIKLVRRLKTSSKARREAGLYVAEGIHLVSSFLQTGQAPELYFYAQSAVANDEVAEVLSKLDETNAKLISVADSLFESITNLHASTGIAVIFKAPMAPTLAILSKSAILLEDIQDPGNLGTILRTATAVGIEDVVLSSGSASPWSPKALRSGMGAQFALNIYEDANLVEVTKNTTVMTIATSLAEDSKSLYDLDLAGPIVWIFGNEGQGVSASLASSATNRVMIPQMDSTVESLNVSAAAAVCLYEQYRQLNFAS